MKKYIGIRMIKNSRFIDYLDTLDASKINIIAKKVDEYVKENQQYCDKGNYTHLSNIFTSMALFHYLCESGVNEVEAEDIVFSTMYKFMNKQKLTFQKLAKKGWFWPLIKKIVPIGLKKEVDMVGGILGIKMKSQKVCSDSNVIVVSINKYLKNIIL